MTLLTPNSQNEGTRTKIDSLKAELNEMGVFANRLTVLFSAPNEMIIGEVSFEDFSEADSKAVVRVTNPKRLLRLQMMDKTSGDLHADLRLSDFDFITGGSILVKHSGGFRIDWLDDDSQVMYLQSYKSFLDGKKIASAQAAGIVIPDIKPNPKFSAK